MLLFFGILLGVLTLVAISMRKAYRHIPARELKRRARTGDPYAVMLHRATTYGASLDVVLWGLVGICAAGFFVIIARQMPGWLAFFGVLSVLWFGFAWMPAGRVSIVGQRITTGLTPTVAWVLAKLHPIVARISEFVRHHRPITVHTGMYEKEDLLELLDQQKVQAHNRISEDELRIAHAALQFGDKLIRDVMTPRRMMRTVKVGDSIGPVLMGELHDSGFSRFPVTGETVEEFVGTLFLRDLVGKKAGGTVKNAMNPDVYYVNDEKPLAHALNAFLKTKHHLFIVVNSFEEVVGLITVEDILEQIIGKQIVDEFDQYDDLRAVALLQASEERREHDHPLVEESAEEVVE